MTGINSAEPRVVLQQPPSLILREIDVDARKIAKQRQIIPKLDESGHDISESLRKLANFERGHVIDIACYRRIMRKLTASTDSLPAKKP
jgi:hypothetical protein